LCLRFPRVTGLLMTVSTRQGIIISLVSGTRLFAMG
jgi:hypothetical protein